MNYLINQVKAHLKIIIAFIVIILISLLTILYFKHEANVEANRYREILDNVTKTAEYNKELAKENKIVMAAIDDLRNNKPVKETITNNNTDTIRYIEKSSPEDPDVVVNKEKTASIRYNGETFSTPLQSSAASSVAKEDGTVEIKQKDEVVIDVTDIANRQIAAHDLMRDKVEQELRDDVKKLKHENRNYKIAGVALGTAGIGYAIYNAKK